MYGMMQTCELTEFIPFVCNPAIWGQSCFLVRFASCIPQLLSNHPGWWQHPLITALEDSFTFGGQKWLMAVTFFVY